MLACCLACARTWPRSPWPASAPGLLDVAPAAMIGDIIGSGPGGTLVASFQMAGTSAR